MSTDDGERRPEFERLLVDTVSRELGGLPSAIGLSGSARARIDEHLGQDIDIIVISDDSNRSRLHMRAFGRTLDIRRESERSLASALRPPSSVPLIKFLSETLVLHDPDGVLSAAVETARALLRGPAPKPPAGEVQRTAESARELLDWLNGVGGKRRVMVRGALLEKVVALAYVRAGCWPAPLHRVVETITPYDGELALRLIHAIEGDDAELGALVNDLTADEPVANPQKVPTISEEITSLAPPALARLSAEDVATLTNHSLQAMSRLQLLTIRRVHESLLNPDQQRTVAALLGDR